MLRTADRRRARPGFTLVELLVAAAVCVLIMAILAGAFSLGIDTVRQMKGAGDMMDQLRGAGVVLKDDLKARHFMTPDGGQKKLSDFRYDEVRVENVGTMMSPQYELKGWGGAPGLGFFRVRSTPFTVAPLADVDRLSNGTGIATDHYLHFTSILEGATDDDYFRATALNSFNNPQSYHSTVAEIGWFLEGPIGTTPGGTNLYRLIRRQRLVAVNDTDRRDRPWPGSNTLNQSVISLRPTGANPPFFLNTLADLTHPSNRLGLHADPIIPSPTGGASDTILAPMFSRPGEDTVLSNVLSFEVQVAYAGSGSPGEPTRAGVPSMTVGTTPYPRDFDIAPGGSTEYPFDHLPYQSSSRNTRYAATTTPAPMAHTYDSWHSAFDSSPSRINQTTGQLISTNDVPPLLIRVQAVQIRIRVWEPKTQSARQLTFVQDL